MKNIILIGFMGSGKTRVGKRLAERLGYHFIDTDHLIEEKTGKAIRDIFKEEGEEYFRTLETGVVKDLSNIEGCVVSTGGGIVIREENMTGLKKIGLVVWLKVSPETVLKRVGPDTTRPLLMVDDPLSGIKRLLAEREESYKKADVSINTDDLDVEEIIENIMSIYDRLQVEGRR